MAHTPTPWSLRARPHIERGHPDIERYQIVSGGRPVTDGFFIVRDDVELTVRAVNAFEANEELIKELVEALKELRRAVCGETGFANAVRLVSGTAYPWPALDAAEEIANAALAKAEQRS